MEYVYETKYYINYYLGNLFRLIDEIHLRGIDEHMRGNDKVFIQYIHAVIRLDIFTYPFFPPRKDKYENFWKTRDKFIEALHKIENETFRLNKDLKHIFNHERNLRTCLALNGIFYVKPRWARGIHEYEEGEESEEEGEFREDFEFEEEVAEEEE